MKTATYAAILLATVLIGGCGDSSSEDKALSTEQDPNPQVDTDPTPDTGTGGDSQTASPDGTVNGAPAQKTSP